MFGKNDSIFLETSGLPFLDQLEHSLVIGELIATLQSVNKPKLRYDRVKLSFQTIFELASIGIAQVDLASGKLLRVNRQLCAITGYNSEELLQKTFAEITHPSDSPDNERALKQHAKNTTGEYCTEKRYIRKDGTIAWVRINARVIPETIEKPYRTIATIEDIGERKRSEEERLRLVTAMEQAAESIVITNLDSTIVYVNPAFEKTTGLSKAEILGRTPRLLKSGKQPKQVYQQLWQRITSGEVWHGRLVNRQKTAHSMTKTRPFRPFETLGGK